MEVIQLDAIVAATFPPRLIPLARWPFRKKQAAACEECEEGAASEC